GGWNGIGTLFDELRPPLNPGAPRIPRPGGPPDRDPRRPSFGQVLIADNSGTIVASDNPNVVGQTLSADILMHGAPLKINDQQIGTLVIGAAFGILGPQERQLLDTVSSALLLTGLLTTAAAIALALW